MGLAESKFKVTTIVRDKLLNDSEIVTLIDDKIYPVVAPDGTIGDFIAYQRDGYSKQRSVMGTALTKPLIYVSAISEDYDRSQHLAYLIDKCLDPEVNDPDSDLKMHLIDSTEDFADGKFIQVLLFEII